MLMCMFRDPGIIVRPNDFIKKKAIFELEEKQKREEQEKKRLEEAKDKFGRFCISYHFRSS